MTDTPLFEVAEPDDTLTVREVSQRLAQLLKREFKKELWVRGQIRNLSRSQRGHVYFSLVEPVEGGRQPDVALNVVLFDSTRQIVNRALKRSGAGRIEDGMEIRIRAAVDYYPPQGALQLQMSAIDPEYTLGRLAADRDQLLRVLSAEGLLNANAQVPMPVVPLRVALVTSKSSAAAADFQNQLAASRFRFDVRVFDARVQGVTAAESIRRALLLALDTDIDVIALVRGGGSKTDLATFDNEEVCREIADCPVPVLTGIGHEIDRSLADEVAHLALKTPTACAQVLIDAVALADARFADYAIRVAEIGRQRPAEHELILELLAGRVVTATQASLDQTRANTTALAHRVRREALRQQGAAASRLTNHAARVRPAALSALRIANQEADRTSERLARASTRTLADHARSLAATAARLKAYDPAETLRRGWSITTDADGRVLRSVADAEPGSTLVTRLADGRITSTTDAVEQLAPADSPSP